MWRTRGCLRAKILSISAVAPFLFGLAIGFSAMSSGVEAAALEWNARSDGAYLRVVQDEDFDGANSGDLKMSGATFMKPLNRLSSILGSVHFLRSLCGDPNAAIWRQKMDELIEAQAPGDDDRKALIASFNNGYRAFESVYRKCTPAARLAVDRYQKEGADLTREIGARYGN